MSHMPVFIQDLALMLGAAGLVSLFMHRWGQATIIGFFLVGIALGPHTPGFIVHDAEGVRIWAEIGVIFLLFAMGLKFKMQHVITGSTRSLAASILQVGIMFVIGFIAAKCFSINNRAALVWGVILSLCSSVVVSKIVPLTMDHEPQIVTNTAIRMTLVEDFFAILVLTAISSLAVQPSLEPFDIARGGVQLIAVMALWIFTGRIVLPWVFRHIGRSKSDELLVLAGVASCFGLVSLAAYFNYSIALGAFMMGSLLAETREGPVLARLMNPLKDIFGAVFFISIGMMLNPTVVLEHWPKILCFSVLVLFGKYFSVYVASRLSGLSHGPASLVARKLPHIGEFSIILATVAATAGYIPKRDVSIVVAIAILTITLSSIPGRVADQFSLSEHT